MPNTKKNSNSKPSPKPLKPTQLKQQKKRGRGRPPKKKKKKAEEKPKPAWWREEPKLQEYDEAFFEPYFDALEPKLPPNYKDPIFEEEWGFLMKKTEQWPKPTVANLNIPALFGRYGEIHKEMIEEKILVSILIPSGDGMMTLNCGVSLSTMYKPHHRVHTVVGHNIGILRNMLVDMALKTDDCTHVFFLDSDVVMPPYGLMRLVRRSMSSKDMDIVAGIYTMKAPPYVPLTIMRPKHHKTGQKKFNYYFLITEKLLNKVVPCDATGAGALLIKREVLEKMGPPWFQVTPQQHGLSAIGEDLFFFDKAIDCGYQPMLDLSVQCGHAMGSIVYPNIFFQQHATRGPQSLQTVNIWNKNSILWSMDLPLYKIPPPKQPQTGVGPPISSTPQPVEVEMVEAVGDARILKKE